MHFHTPFHPFQRHPFTGQSSELLNLLLILFGVALVLLLRPWTN